ncbi:MAG: hypothetical protein VB025_09165 [Sphaerochaeta sp.]|nr:hypothetical protein [Sphaerochaeta sp.]
MAKDLKVKISSDSGDAVRGIKKVTDEVHGLGSAAGSSEEKVKGLDEGLDGLDSPKAKQGISSIKTGLTAAGVVAAAVYLSIKKIVATAQEYVALYAVQAKAEASLSAAIRATGQESEFTIGNLREQAGALQAVTVHGDETILTLQQMMVQTKKIGSDIMPLATEAALDMAAALGTGLQENSKKLARALADPVEGITLLKASMISFSPEQQKMIKDFTEQGDIVGAQRVILDQLSASYGGLARAQAAVSTAKIEQISNLMGDIKEGLGQNIIEGLSPAMDWLLEKLGIVNTKIAEANRLSGVVKPSDMSDQELTITWQLKKVEMEELEDDITKAAKMGGYRARLEAQKAYNDQIAIYNALNEEANRRAKESGYASATAYGKAYLEAMERQKLNNPITPEDERHSMRAAGAATGSSPAISGNELFGKAKSAQEETFALVQQTEGYQRLILTQRIAELEARKAQNTEEMRSLQHNRDLLGYYTTSNGLIDEQLQLYYSMRDGQSDITKFVETNAWYARETADQEKARLEMALQTAQAFLLQRDITAEESENIQKIVTGLEQALKQLELPVEPSEIEQFMEANALYAKETAEQEKVRLEAALATAQAYLVQKDLTEEQRKNIEAIIVGLKQAQGTEANKSYYEQLQENFKKKLPTEGIRHWLLEAKSAAQSVADFMQDQFGDVLSFGLSFYNTLVDAQENAAEAQIRILEKQMAAEKKLYEKQTKLIQSQYDMQTKTLADKYAWGLISYEQYIAAQNSLDDAKTASEEAAAARYKQLEKDKEAISNKVAKIAFENQKKQSYVEAVIGGAAAAVQALKLGPIAGPIAALVIAGLVGKQLGIISSQEYSPQVALAEGGIAYKPVTALIGEGGEPEIVAPLSRAKEFGFGGGGVTNHNTNIYMSGPVYSFDQFSEMLAAAIVRGQRTGRIPGWQEGK